MTRLLVLVAAVASINAFAQRKGDQMQMVRPPKGTVCYASSTNEHTYIGPPAEYLKAQARKAAGRTKAASFVVTYHGFTSEARDAFQQAVDIWEALIDTPEKIYVDATWEPLGQGVLGSASPGTYIANFDGAPKRDVWYPVSLAEKIAGKEINDTGEADISASFNSAMDQWHFGSSLPPAGKYDLTSIVLHEIGHGLGISHGYTIEGGLGTIPSFFSGRPVVYETNITVNGVNFVDGFQPPSSSLRDAITSQNLFFTSRIVRLQNGGVDAKIYAPATYSGGSSIAHLDEATYPSGSANSLMTPFIGAAERMLDPGPISMSILKEMGWHSTVIKHTPLKSTESVGGPFPVVAKIVTDGDKDSVVAAYKTTLHGNYIPLKLNPTGIADEYAANLPTGNSKYWYYIGARDVHERTLTTPGIIIKPGADDTQGLIVFEVGPDNKAPIINHTPKEFITKNDDLDLQAIISDNLGIAQAVVEYKVNGVSQTEKPMTLKVDTDSTYEISVDIPVVLNVGDKIEYRIRAKDTSIAGNTSFKPSSTTYFDLNVTGLGETEDSYSNNFDDLSSTDFFGNGFSVRKPDGFSNGAIHTDHPYADGGAAGAHVDLIYNLKTPIRIAATNAILKFDEIVLIEPGEDGIPWPEPDFYDYVVVEGSNDGGQTWEAIDDGYDSRITTFFENLWFSSNSGNNSTAVGGPSMYRAHTFDLGLKYQPGEEVAIRFRLYSDPFSFGWGWSIDNLKIQVDDTPPSLKHNHYDFFLAGKNSVDLVMKVTDLNGISDLSVQYNVNGGSDETVAVVLNPALSDYTVTVDLSQLDLDPGDEFKYKIKAIDGRGNTASFPSSGYITAPIISLTSSVDEYVTDFSATSTASADITRNFFSIQQPSGFTSAGMSSIHPYDVGLGLDGTSNFTWMLKTPVKVATENALVFYEDVLIAEYDNTTLKDYAIVEASKDGINWTPLVSAYSSDKVLGWRNAFDNVQNGSQSLMQGHTLDLTAGGQFKPNDLVLVRFRLFSNALTNGWGWHVDNLSIQGSITGLELSSTGIYFDAWPNPVADGSLFLKFASPKPSDVSVEFLTTHGQLLSSDTFSAPVGDFERHYNVDKWPDGFYIVRVRSEFGTSVRKLIKVR